MGGVLGKLFNMRIGQSLAHLKCDKVSICIIPDFKTTSASLTANIVSFISSLTNLLRAANTLSMFESILPSPWSSQYSPCLNINISIVDLN